MGKGEMAQNEPFHFFPQCFLCSLYLKNPVTATFQLSSAASLNLGRCQNGVLWKGLRQDCIEHIALSSVNTFR